MTIFYNDKDCKRTYFFVQNKIEKIYMNEDHKHTVRLSLAALYYEVIHHTLTELHLKSFQTYVSSTSR